MENNHLQQIEITVECHVMTKEEIKQSKLEAKQRKKERRQARKNKKREVNTLKNNFKTMNRCLIHPSNIKIGNLEKCIYSRMEPQVYFMGMSFGCIDEKYEPIEGEKLFIQISKDYDLYVDLDEINSDKDLNEIRKQITIEGIITGKKILGCSNGKIRIDRKTLHPHPYFNERKIDAPISLKMLKKTIDKSH